MTIQPTSPDATAAATSEVFTREGYVVAEAQYLTPSSLRYLDVHDRDDARVGGISALLVGHDDVITDAVVDIGGFLGIGMHSIRVPLGALTVLRKQISTDLHIRMDATEDQIKSMPYHDE